MRAPSKAPILAAMAICIVSASASYGKTSPSPIGGRTGQAKYLGVNRQVLRASLSTYGHRLAAQPGASAAGTAAASAAVMTGSFDPPTKAHLALMKQALSQPGVSKLYVIVNLTGGKDFKASAQERVAMIRNAMKGSDDRLEIMVRPEETREQTIQGLVDVHGGRLQQFIGEDSFRKVPKEQIRSGRRSWVVVRRPTEGQSRKPELQLSSVRWLDMPQTKGMSSTNARKNLRTGRSAVDLSRAVASYIERHQLYRQLPSGLLDLQQQMYRDAFRDFVGDMSRVAPELKLSASKLPPFAPTQSQAAWGDKFIRWLVEKKNLKGADAGRITRAAQRVVFGLFRGKTYTKLPFLEPEPMPSAAAPRIKAARTFSLPKLKQGEHYTLDVKSYVADRLPPALQRFIRDEKVPLFFHDGATAESLAYHRAAGFTQAYLVRTRRGQPHRVIHLLMNPQTGARRVVLSDIRSADRMAHVVQQIGAAGVASLATMVQHEKVQGLIDLAPAAEKLRCRETDQVVVGYKNSLWKELSATGQWTRQSITRPDAGSVGAEIDVYENKETGQRIFNARAVYGDDAYRLAKFFYNRGARRFTYFGTAGALDPKMKVGDVVLINRVAAGSGKWIPLQNTALSKAPSTLAGAATVHRDVAHGSVRTILSETDGYLRELQGKGVQSLDVEMKPWAKFFAERPKAKTAVALFVSDQPLGKTTLDEHNASSQKLKDVFPQVLKSLGIAASAKVVQPRSLWRAARSRGQGTLRAKAFSVHYGADGLGKVDLRRLPGYDGALREIFELAQKHNVTVGTWGGTSRDLLLAAGRSKASDLDLVCDSSQPGYSAFEGDLHALQKRWADQGRAIDLDFSVDRNPTNYQRGLYRGLTVDKIAVLSDGSVYDFTQQGLQDLAGDKLRYHARNEKDEPGISSIFRMAKSADRYPGFRFDSATMGQIRGLMARYYGPHSRSTREMKSFYRELRQRHGLARGPVPLDVIKQEIEAAHGKEIPGKNTLDVLKLLNKIRIASSDATHTRGTLEWMGLTRFLRSIGANEEVL